MIKAQDAIMLEWLATVIAVSWLDSLIKEDDGKTEVSTCTLKVYAIVEMMTITGPVAGMVVPQEMKQTMSDLDIGSQLRGGVSSEEKVKEFDRDGALTASDYLYLTDPVIHTGVFNHCYAGREVKEWMDDYLRTQLMHEIAHCHATEIKDATLGEEPKRQKFNVVLNEENELQYARTGAVMTLDRQAVEVEAIQGLHIERSLEMINLLLRQNPFPHPLQGVQQSGRRETVFVGRPQPLPSSVEWSVVLTDLGKRETLPGCMTCIGDCKPECYGIKTVNGSTEAMKTVFAPMTMYPLDEASLESWHPAITEMGPHSTFAILAILETMRALRN